MSALATIREADGLDSYLDEIERRRWEAPPAPARLPRRTC